MTQHNWPPERGARRRPLPEDFHLPRTSRPAPPIDEVEWIDPRAGSGLALEPHSGRYPKGARPRPLKSEAAIDDDDD